MDGTNTERVKRLAHYLLTHPQNIFSYLKYHPLRKKGPLEYKLPWFAQEAIDFLDDWINKDTNIFEWGVGGSTLFFAERGNSVHSIESDKRWFELCNDILSEEQKKKVQVELQEINNDSHFAHSPYLKSLKSKNYDIISIDGLVDHKRTYRELCFHHAQKHIKPNGIIIVDDIWMFSTILTNNSAKNVNVFEGTGPCRPGVTQTAIFHY